ncbi:MAG TPA: hypothetical protein VLH19_00060 [Patescibacteria group bacterium]|nr:hypothetical protein [Patescibacteria group bacterium]
MSERIDSYTLEEICLDLRIHFGNPPLRLHAKLSKIESVGFLGTKSPEEKVYLFPESFRDLTRDEVYKLLYSVYRQELERRGFQTNSLRT